MARSPQLVSLTWGRGTPFHTRKIRPSESVPALRLDPRSGMLVGTGGDDHVLFRRNGHSIGLQTQSADDTMVRGGSSRRRIRERWFKSSPSQEYLLSLPVFRELVVSTQRLELAQVWSPGQPCGTTPPAPRYRITSSGEPVTA